VVRLSMTEWFRRPPSPVQLLALALVAVGGIGSVLVVATTDEDAELGGAVWAVIALVGWWFPLIAAALLIVLAVLGGITAFVALFVEYYEPGVPSFGSLFFWEFLLPIVCALLLVGAHRQGRGRASIW
jgi:hypothetical protein